MNTMQKLLGQSRWLVCCCSLLQLSYAVTPVMPMQPLRPLPAAKAALQAAKPPAAAAVLSKNPAVPSLKSGLPDTPKSPEAMVLDLQWAQLLQHTALSTADLTTAILTSPDWFRIFRRDPRPGSTGGCIQA